MRTGWVRTGWVRTGRPARARDRRVPYDRAVTDRRLARGMGRVVPGSATWSYVGAWIAIVVAAFAIGTAGYIVIGGWSQFEPAQREPFGPLENHSNCVQGRDLGLMPELEF